MPWIFDKSERVCVIEWIALVARREEAELWRDGNQWSLLACHGDWDVFKNVCKWSRELHHQQHFEISVSTSFFNCLLTGFILNRVNKMELILLLWTYRSFLATIMISSVCDLNSMHAINTHLDFMWNVLKSTMLKDEYNVPYINYLNDSMTAFLNIYCHL